MKVANLIPGADPRGGQTSTTEKPSKRAHEKVQEARLREAWAQLDEFLSSDEAKALDRFAEILEAARTDPAIAKAKHIRELVEYLVDVAEHRWRELLNGDGVGALREVANERSRLAAALPRKGVTGAELLAFRDAFAARHGNARGWKASAQAHFGVGPKVLAKRLAGD